MKERLTRIKDLIIKHDSKIIKLEGKIEPINQKIKGNDDLIKRKKELLKEQTSTLEKIKEDKVVSFLLSPKFNIIPIGITIALSILSLIFSTVILFVIAILFGFSYLCANAITRNMLKKELPEVILEKLLPEYANCISEVSKIKEEINCLNQSNQKLGEDKAPVEYELKIERKKLESLILKFLVELSVEITKNTEKEGDLTMHRLSNIIGQCLGLPNETEEPPKVYTIGTKPGSETL